MGVTRKTILAAAHSMPADAVVDAQHKSKWFNQLES